MKKGLTEIVFVLDKSGSMTNLVEDTIGGFNSFIDQQRKVEGEANISLFLFDHNYYRKFVSIPLERAYHIGRETYSPGGMTALIDGVGRAIDEMGNEFSLRPEEEKPENVIFCITTDGLENSSKEYSKKQIAERIKHQEDKYNWRFVFFGANIDSFAEAGSIGVSRDLSSNYDHSPIGVSASYMAFSNMTEDLRKTGSFRKTASETYDEVLEEEKKKEENK